MNSNPDFDDLKVALHELKALDAGPEIQAIIDALGGYIATGEPLCKSLGLSTHAWRQHKFETRNYHLKQCALHIRTDSGSPWTKAVALEKALKAFKKSYWLRFRGRDQPPTYFTNLRFHCWCVLKTDSHLLTSRQIFTIIR